MIPLSGPDVGEHEVVSVTDALRNGWVSGTGPAVAEFEAALAQRIGRSHVIATANGSMALELALRTLEIGPGDEVLVPAFTFAAPALSVLAVGATPVLVDVSPETWTIDASAAVAERTRRTKAVIAVDVLGHPCDYDALRDLELPVIEDAAQAHGARYKGRPTGSFGIAAAFSFHANKAISTGEGGALATDSDELARRMRLLCNHGMTPSEPYVHRVVGRNYRMTNLTASVGVAQVGRWDELIAARDEVGARYAELLRHTGATFRPVADWAVYSCWLQTIGVQQGRDALVNHMRERGIDTRAIWPTLSTQPLMNPAGKRCPVAEELSERLLLLPTYASLHPDSLTEICRVIREFGVVRSATATPPRARNGQL